MVAKTGAVVESDCNVLRPSIVSDEAASVGLFTTAWFVASTTRRFLNVVCVFVLAWTSTPVSDGRMIAA